MDAVRRYFALILPMGAALLAASAALGIAAASEGSSKAVPCAPCHGAAGVSRYAEIPHLAGQQRDYLIAEMKSFRRATDPQAPTRHWNRRRDRIMDHQLSSMSDVDIESLAAHFAGQSCALPMTLGEQTLPALARRCVSCHGEDGRSAIATVPHLAGQQPRYLENQLRAFRDSRGRDDQPRTRIDPIMGHQTVTLGDADIVALAAYFSGRRCR